MKTKIAAAILALAAMFTTACEEHSWSETSQLFKGHGEHGKAGEHEKAGTGEHGKAEGHAEAAKHE